MNDDLKSGSSDESDDEFDNESDSASDIESNNECNNVSNNEFVNDKSENKNCILIIIKSQQYMVSWIIRLLFLSI